MLLAGCGIRPVCRDRLDLRKEPHAVFSKHVQIPEEGVLVPAERENADRNRNPDIDADHAAIRAAGALLSELGCVDADYADAMVEREKLITTYMGMGVAIPHGTSEKKGTVKKSGVVVMQYPDGVDFGDEKAYLIFGIAGVGDAHLDLLGKICTILEDEDVLDAMKTTNDVDFLLSKLQ